MTPNFIPKALRIWEVEWLRRETTYPERTSRIFIEGKHPDLISVAIATNILVANCTDTTASSTTDLNVASDRVFDSGFDAIQPDSHVRLQHPHRGWRVRQAVRQMAQR
ncbi:MAG: hypothetical protein F6J95_023270 [Leptolyngbya sp. SIO1E4]|nr:hypothetical protein [Leptolyngbya sp. SIO1E4]